MQGFNNSNSEEEDSATYSRLADIEKKWLEKNSSEHTKLVEACPSGDKRYNWDYGANEICQRLPEHGKTASIDNQHGGSRNVDWGRMFNYCKTCGWYVTWSYCG